MGDDDLHNIDEDERVGLESIKRHNELAETFRVCGHWRRFSRSPGLRAIDSIKSIFVRRIDGDTMRLDMDVPDSRVCFFMQPKWTQHGWRMWAQAFDIQDGKGGVTTCMAFDGELWAPAYVAWVAGESWEEKLTVKTAGRDEWEKELILGDLDRQTIVAAVEKFCKQ